MTQYRRADLTRSCTSGGRSRLSEMWENHQWFAERAVPVAEEAGVRLGAPP